MDKFPHILNLGTVKKEVFNSIEELAEFCVRKGITNPEDLTFTANEHSRRTTLIEKIIQNIPARIESALGIADATEKLNEYIENYIQHLDSSIYEYHLPIDTVSKVKDVMIQKMTKIMDAIGYE